MDRPTNGATNGRVRSVMRPTRWSTVAILLTIYRRQESWRPASDWQSYVRRSWWTLERRPLWEDQISASVEYTPSCQYPSVPRTAEVFRIIHMIRLTFTSTTISTYVKNLCKMFSYLRQGGYVFAGFCLSISLFVCVSKITQKVMDLSFWNFGGMSGMA